MMTQSSVVSPIDSHGTRQAGRRAKSFRSVPTCASCLPVPSGTVTAAAGSDAVALVTDWPQYTTLPFRKIAATMNTPLIFDGRNCLNRDVMRENGFQYYPIGRPAVENALRLKNRA